MLSRSGRQAGAGRSRAEWRPWVDPAREPAIWAAVYYGNNIFDIEDVPEPIVSAGHVKVRVRRNGICGTDLHKYFDGPMIEPTWVRLHWPPRCPVFDAELERFLATPLSPTGLISSVRRWERFGGRLSMQLVRRPRPDRRPFARRLVDCQVTRAGWRQNSQNVVT